MRFVCDRVIGERTLSRIVDCLSGCGKQAHQSCVASTGLHFCRVCDRGSVRAGEGPGRSEARGAPNGVEPPVLGSVREKACMPRQNRLAPGQYACVGGTV